MAEKKPKKQYSMMTPEEQAAYVEPGAESEGFFDVLRPFKKKSIEELRERGVPEAVTTGADLLTPEGPEALVGRVARGVKAGGAMLGIMRGANKAEKATAATRAAGKEQELQKSWYSLSKAERENWPGGFSGFIRKQAEDPFETKNAISKAVSEASKTEKAVPGVLNYSDINRKEFQKGMDKARAGTGETLLKNKGVQPEVAEMQNRMQDLTSQGKYQEAKKLQSEIATKRDPSMVRDAEIDNLLQNMRKK